MLSMLSPVRRLVRQIHEDEKARIVLPILFVIFIATTVFSWVMEPPARRGAEPCPAAIAMYTDTIPVAEGDSQPNPEGFNSSPTSAGVLSPDGVTRPFRPPHQDSDPADDTAPTQNQFPDEEPLGYIVIQQMEPPHPPPDRFFPILSQLPKPFWIGDWSQNLSTEMLGAVMTFMLIEWFARGREERRRLLLDLSGSDNLIAKRAAREARARGMLKDGELAKKDFSEANMAGIDLRGAKLTGAKFRKVDLTDADLREVDLTDAELIEADLSAATLWRAKAPHADFKQANLAHTTWFQSDLSHADLSRANLSAARLWHVDLSYANLRNADLKGADLRNCKLVGARLSGAIFDEHTVLPDSDNLDSDTNPSSFKYWTVDTDMSRYTNPKHPEYWQPNRHQDQGGMNRQPQK